MRIKWGKPEPAFKREIDRQLAREAGMEALGIERVFTNYYRCLYCGTHWRMRWSCACDDDCPDCNISHSPYDYVIDNEIEEEESPT